MTDGRRGAGASWEAPTGQIPRPAPSLLDGSAAIVPLATEEEAAVIVAALDALWPRPVVVTAVVAAGRRSAWRFSGRWWSLPVQARRERPRR